MLEEEDVFEEEEEDVGLGWSRIRHKRSGKAYYAHRGKQVISNIMNSWL